MAAPTQETEQATKLLQNLTLETQTQPADGSEATKQSPTSQYSAGETANNTNEAAAGMGPSTGRSSTPVVQDLAMDPTMFYVPNGYPHQQAYYYGGFDGPIGEWEEYRYVNADGMEIPATGVYGDNGSLVYHPGYGYAPQVPYGPYSPAGTPVPTMGADGQLYGHQAFQYTGPFYQQPVPAGAQYTPSPPPLMQGDVPTSVSADQVTLDSSNAAAANGTSNGITLGPRPTYPMPILPSNGSYGRGGILPQNHEGMRSVGPWLDGPPSDGQLRPPTTNPMAPVISQTTSPGPLGQNVRPLPHLMPHIQGVPHPRPPSGMGPGPGFMNRMYPSNRMYSHNNASGRSSPGFVTNGFESRPNGRSWNASDRAKPKGRGSGSMVNNNENLDILNEQNRGPRTARFRNQRAVPGAPWIVKQVPNSNGNSEDASVVPHRDQYNRPEFVTKYTDAKFFIIKSYSEDDIHKSIKYSVWASTPNGNKKLDAAYKESQEKAGPCPVFLFFSVNASGQFCGVAEMMGPVDFNQSVDFWQQDKWSGRFSVKWHIVKDVPNNQLRHIQLENNDNKPVTNSRDTQEVKFDKGVEMLKIFKDYVSKTSILDDFLFYENRQKAMQDKRSRQQTQQQQKQGSQLQPGSEGDQLLSEGSALKAQDARTGDASVEDKEVKSSLLQSSDLPSVAVYANDKQHHDGQKNQDSMPSEERGVPTGPGEAWKGSKANPTVAKREANGDAVDMLVHSNGS